MTQLKTHLLTEDPAIVLIGKNTVLRSQIIKMLQKQKLQVVSVEPKDILEGKSDLSLFENAYKVIWLYECEDNDKYLNILGVIKQVKIPVIVVASLITNLSSFNSDLLKSWRKKSQKQTQFIVDCNYHLPKASFIFGRDVIFSSITHTSLRFMVQNIGKGIIIDPGFDLGLVEMGVFVENIKEHIFKPGKKGSVLIKGEETNSSLIVGMIKKLYDSYHNTNIEIISDSAEKSDLVPFSVKKKTVGFNLKKIISRVVRDLGVPQEIEASFKVKRPDENLKEESLIIDSSMNEVENKLSNKVEESQKLEVAESVAPEPKKIDVDNEIQRIFQSSRAKTKVNRIRKIAKNTKKIDKKSGRKKAFFIGGVGVAGVAIGIIVLVLSFFISQSILRKELISFISKGVVDQEEFLIENSGLKGLTEFVGLQVSGYGSIIESSLITKVSSMVEMSEGLQSVPQMLLEVDEASKNLVLQVLTGDINETGHLAQILDDKARLAYENLSEIQANFDLIDLGISSEDKELAVLNYESKLREIRGGIAIQQQLQPILSSLTGEASKKTYAVILQNNQELRPTGGFIQAVALLNFDGGSLVSYDIYSVYEIDKKLPGVIIPPSDITNYLGEEKWYLRDSNWNPDFPTTSKQIGWFISKSLGIDVDGVVAINLLTVRDILEATGPVDLSEHNEVITHKNILERMEFHSEVVLINSSASTDYSVVVFRKILEKIVGISREKVSALLFSLENSIEDSQLAISVFEESDQAVLRSLGWTGSLVKPSCPTQLSLVDCKVDVVAQVEANIGVNKANYYLGRSINHEIAVDREKAAHTRKITFKNNAKSNSWPKGTYKSYQRFYLDKNAVVDRVLINGSALIDEQISQKEVGGFKEIGIRVDVPIQKQVEIELEYSTSHSFRNGFSYVFFNKKQPGTSGDPLKVVFKYSDDIEPVLIAPSAEVYDKTIVFNDGSSNSLFSVEFE